MTAHSHVRLQFRCLGNRSALTLKPHQKQTLSVSLVHRQTWRLTGTKLVGKKVSQRFSLRWCDKICDPHSRFDSNFKMWYIFPFHPVTISRRPNMSQARDDLVHRLLGSRVGLDDYDRLKVIYRSLQDYYTSLVCPMPTCT